MKKYQPTIGLEIHVELKTKTKMFCDCLNNSLEKKANKNICPICTAQPGVLPVINQEAIDMAIKAGLALNCKIAEKTWFERKNYFYPDLPKGYQISQYEAPIARNGELMGVRIKRIHLEEDAGKLIHLGNSSLVDFNRAGVPLMELVTEPDIKSAEQAKKFSQELQLIFRYLGISDADMEKGQLRVEANISLLQLKSQIPNPKSQTNSKKQIQNSKLGTKVEVKNLNSFKAVERAIAYEIKRQEEILESGEKVVHETRGWNETKQKTFSQRTKETSDDYRYFPEPDLPPLNFFPKQIEKLAFEIPELPQARRDRFKKEYKISEDAIETLVVYKNLGDFFEQAVSELKAWLKSGKIKTDIDKLIKLSANYIITEFPKYVEKGIKFTPENFAELIYLTFIGEISSSGAQEVLKQMFKKGGDPSQIIESRGLKQVSDEKDLEKIVEKIIKNNPQAVKDYKKGKAETFQFLVGQIMKLSRGRANPQIAAKLLTKALASLPKHIEIKEEK